MKTMLIAAAALTGAAAGMATTATAAAGQATAAPAMNASDTTYMQMAHSSDMFEVESSRLALQMSTNQEVRAYAQMMVDDHTRMMNEMMSTGAGPANMPMQMTPQHTAMLERVRTASPADFDMIYKREQMMAHQEAVALHRTYAGEGQNPMLKAMAARAVPMVEAHLARAQSLPEIAAGTTMPPASARPYEAPAPTPTSIRRRGERG
jgi:putative membrane protein